VKKFISALVIVVLVIVTLKIYVFLEQDRCLDSGGAWFENLCVGTDTPEEELKKIGLIEETKTDKTDIRITYDYKVLEYPEIYKQLKVRVEDIKEEWGFDVPQPDIETASYPWALNIDMNNFTQAGDLASVLGYVFSFTGGAHPNHTFFTVNFNTENQKLFYLSDLFKDLDGAIKAISEYTVKEILKQKSERLGDQKKDEDWVNQGAGPREKNYNIFTIVPEDHKKIRALKFIFPPYTVGAYAEGTYEVVVPSGIFYEKLDDKYKANFINIGD